jgi:hypothetical protein
MTITRDPDSLTNSVVQAMDKEFRKNGISPVFHRHMTGNRKLIRGMIAIMLAEVEAEEAVTKQLDAIAQAVDEQTKVQA